MEINKEQVYKLYMQKVEKIADECDWKTHFTPEECVNLVCNVLQENPSLIEYPDTNESEFSPATHAYKLAYMRDFDYEYLGCEFYILGIIDTQGKFLDFYYNSGLEYEEFQKFIPKEFSEASESVYEFSIKRHPGKTAKEILEKYGYVEFTTS